MLAVLLLAAIAAVVVVLASGGGSASHPKRALVESMFQDDAYTLDQPNTAVVAQTLRTLKALGVDRIRVQMLWGSIAPDGLSSTKPTGFKGADPSSYSVSGWAPYDRLARLAKADGLGLDFDIGAPAPLWAVQRPDPYRRTAFVYAPSAHLFAQFARAIGRRYSGSYVPPGTHDGPLPRIDYWSIWNEPNQPGWLSPQLRKVNGVRVPDSPRLYREYFDAGFRGLMRSGHTLSTDTILIGETAPEGCLNHGRGCSYPPNFRPLPPMPFIRDLYCVDDQYRPLRGTLAAALHCPTSGKPTAFATANPGLFAATGYSHHPYSLSLAPNIPFHGDPGFVSLANLGELEGGLDRIFATYGVKRRMPIYLTEFGYETDPPDPFRGIPLALQARFLDQAEYMAWRDPRVRALSQFLLHDSPPNTKFKPGTVGYWSGFQTGIEFGSGAEKPSFDAYRLPVFIPQPEFASGSAVLVWGMLRPAPNGTAQHAEIEFRPRGGGYHAVATVSTDDPSGVLSARVVLPRSGAVRIAWTAPGGRVLRSRAVRVVRR